MIALSDTKGKGDTMKKVYESPSFVEMGGFTESTAGFGRYVADQLVGRLIP